MEPPLIFFTGPGLAGVTTSLQHFVPYPGSARFEEWQARLHRGGGVGDTGGPPRARILANLRTNLWFPSIEHAAQSTNLWIRDSARFVLAHLAEVRGVVFVADSQLARVEANLERLEATLAELRRAGLDPDDIPFVFQLNKRDIPNVLPVRELRALLRTARCDHVESIAIRGEGVREALRRAIEPLRGAHRALVPRRPAQGSPRRLFDTNLHWSFSSDVHDELELVSKVERLDVGPRITIGWGWPKTGLAQLEAQAGSWRIDVAFHHRRFRSQPDAVRYPAGVRISTDMTVERVEMFCPPGVALRTALVGDDDAVSRVESDTLPKAVHSATWSEGVGLVRHDARAWLRRWTTDAEANLLIAHARLLWIGRGPDGRAVEIGAVDYSGLALLGEPAWADHGEVEP